MQAEVDFREHELVHSLNHEDELVERYLSMQGQTREQYLDELRENAEKSVKAQLLLDAIADRDDVQVGDAELTTYLVRQAARYNLAPKEFANQVIEGGNLPALEAVCDSRWPIASLSPGSKCCVIGAGAPYPASKR